jgi:uncharacterized protein YlxW (UPF0749 family)
VGSWTSNGPIRTHGVWPSARRGTVSVVEAALIVALVLGALVVVVLLVVLGKRKAGHTKQVRREEAEEHRGLAHVAELQAEQQAAEAEERAARARKEHLEAEQQALEAERARTEAGEMRDKADRLDPDVGGRRRR